MNYSIIVYILGWVLNIEAVAMLLPCVVALIYGETVPLFSFLITALVSFVIGLIMHLKKPKNTKFYAKEGFAVVALSWIVISLVGAVPMVLSEDISSYVSALFETVSGFTTTGSSIITDLDVISRATLFWRSETHWIGGMGVLVFLLTIVPMVGGHSMQLMKAESPGPVVDKLRPKIRQTAVILYVMYLVMTVVQCILLLLGGLPLFDAICLSFGTAGTGGFAISNAGIAGYNSAYVEMVVAVFMVLFGINFGVYYMLITKKAKEALKNEELRTFLLIIGLAVTLISLNVYNIYGSLGQTLRNTFFTVASIISSTGYCTANFDLWPEFSKTLIIILMFCGACAGSTGGGMKVSRVMILVKSAFTEIAHTIHPKSITTVKIEGKKVSGETVKNVRAYFILEMMIIAVSMIIVSLDNFEFEVTSTAVITCMHNIGPGLGAIGPVGNFADFSVLSKLVLIFDMLAGRLEIMPLLVFFSAGIWGKTKRKKDSSESKFIKRRNKI